MNLRLIPQDTIKHNVGLSQQNLLNAQALIARKASPRWVKHWCKFLCISATVSVYCLSLVSTTHMIKRLKDLICWDAGLQLDANIFLSHPMELKSKHKSVKWNLQS